MFTVRLDPLHGRPFVFRIVTVSSVILLCLSTRARAVDGIWTDLNPNTTGRITDADLMAVDFVSGSTGITVGAGGTILRTDNGGVTWVQIGSGSTALLNGVSFPDAGHAVVVGDGGTILRSNDGGITWSSQTSGTVQDLLAVHFSDNMTGTAVGAGGTVLRATDGATWSPQASGTTEYLQAVFFMDLQTGVAAGTHGALIRTSNGGTTWQSLSTVVECVNDHGVTLCNSFRDVCFADASVGFVAGFPGEPVLLAGGSFFRTTSGGTSWSTPPAPPSEYDFFVAISFGNNTDGMAFTSGLLPVAYRTADGGDTWTASQMPLLPGSLNAVSHGDADAAFAVGDNGTIMRWNRDLQTPTERQSWGAVKSRFRKQ